MLLPEGFYLFFDKFKLMLVVDNRKSTKTFGGLNLNIRSIQKNHCNQFECQKSTKTFGEFNFNIRSLQRNKIISLSFKILQKRSGGLNVKSLQKNLVNQILCLKSSKID